jgi:hypothetical protein
MDFKYLSLERALIGAVKITRLDGIIGSVFTSINPAQRYATHVLPLPVGAERIALSPSIAFIASLCHLYNIYFSKFGLSIKKFFPEFFG